MSEWISVKHSLPKEDDEYLTYVMDNGCCYSIEVQRFFNKPKVLKGIYADCLSHWEKSLFDDYIVTHWMPLPKPPEKNERMD